MTNDPTQNSPERMKAMQLLSTGEPYARMSMSLGNPAQQAVKHAMDFDANTGGKVRTFKL